VNTYFLDTAYILALEFEADQHHRLAIEYSRRARSGGDRVVTTSFVLDEVVTHLNARGHHAAAVRTGEQLMKGSHIDFVEVDHELLANAWKYFIRHQDKRYSLTDCISFVLMQERGLWQALTFDQHFQQAGFECLPANELTKS
jgi:predicted nucleic acid-binding protein